MQKIQERHKSEAQEKGGVMIKRYRLFTTNMCPKCPSVKAFMKTVRLIGDEIDASTDDGLRKASEAGVSSVPTVILFDEAGKEVKRAYSADEVKRALEEQS